MTKTVAQMAEIMIAFTNGAKIESKMWSGDQDSWGSCSAPKWDWDMHDYRVKEQIPPYPREYFDSLQKIVDQLERCGFECEAGPLKCNAAFEVLKEMADKEVLAGEAVTKRGQWLVCIGTLSEGLIGVYGPFGTSDAASSWAEGCAYKSEWFTVSMRSPE